MKKFLKCSVAALLALSLTFAFAACGEEDDKKGGDETPVAVTGVTLDKTSALLKVGEEATLVATVAPSDATDKTVTWSTSAAAVATVTDGKVKAVATGTANITAKAGDKTAVCAVTVIDAAAIAYYDFSDAEQLAAFCPEADAGECTGEGSVHENFAKGFKINAGKAEIYGSGAWFAYRQCDFAANTYKIAYDLTVNADNMQASDGKDAAKLLAFGAGEGTGWHNDAYFHVYKNADGKLFMGKGQKNDAAAIEISVAELRVETVFSVTDGKFSCVTTVTAGDKTLTVSSAVGEVANPSIYWDVYSPTALSEQAVAAMDNFGFYGYAK